MWVLKTFRGKIPSTYSSRDHDVRESPDADDFVDSDRNPMRAFCNPSDLNARVEKNIVI